MRSFDVMQAINNLSSSSGPGSDGIESKLVKLLAPYVFAPPMAELFNMSFATCEVSLAWEYSKVIPL